MLERNSACMGVFLDLFVFLIIFICFSFLFVVFHFYLSCGIVSGVCFTFSARYEISPGVI